MKQITVPFLDLKKQHKKIKKQILKNWEDILVNASFVGGSWVEKFEDQFKSFCETDACAAVDSGTDALEVALRSLGVKPGDEILAPANTFYATVEAILLIGAIPVLVDCKHGTWNINEDLIEEKLNSKTVGIIGVHLYGNPCEMDTINKIAERHNLWVLEDSAQAHGATYKGRKCGSLGNAAAFSFYPGKNLGSTGEGGAITSNNKEFIDRCKQVRNHGCKVKYVHEILGKNSKMPTLIASALSVKMNYIEEWTEKRRRNAAYYYKYLSNVKQIELPEIKDYSNPVWHLFVVHDKTNNRDKLHEYLKSQNISTGFHYPVPVHMQNHFKNIYKPDDFPVAKYNASQSLSLPMYPELTKKQIKFVCDKVKEFYKQHEKR
tara:strand:- start:22850 stop:23980 length:1131 start_codon:yes stop_codon:yes gene_type:complete